MVQLISESPEELVLARRSTPEWQEMDAIDRIFAGLPQEKFPLKLAFTPGLVSRIIDMPKGAWLTSRIHLKEHQYVVVKGVAHVWTLETGWQEVRAPFMGITKPGTRRLLNIIEDMQWISFHASDAKSQDELDQEIFYDHMKLGHMDNVDPEKMAAILRNQKGVHLNELC